MIGCNEDFDGNLSLHYTDLCAQPLPYKRRLAVRKGICDAVDQRHHVIPGDILTILTTFADTQGIDPMDAMLKKFKRKGFSPNWNK